MRKTITNIEIISAGSAPDIDSDFHTKHREAALQHVAELYGHDNVSNIITFGSMAARKSFKAMCTIYEIPFEEANSVADLLPKAQEGKEVTLKDVFDETSSFYPDCADFRNATSTDKWKPILDGALAVEGRYQSTGVHACGILISSQPLYETIPLQVRKTDGRVITQWTYSECEALGLIKMDFLGLDTVDLIQATIQNIIDAGKTPPSMHKLIHGTLDDKPTLQLFQRGETIGVFQFGSPLVRELLTRMLPTEFEDLVACTAIARPGPMGMNSHTSYADRKNGLEEITYIHPDFNGSIMEDILNPTYGLVVYQETVAKIANLIAGMTLQEGDDLRKAMGKKKAKVMAKMKPRFISGGVNNGYSEQAMTALWDTLEPFAKYAFNKSHSVAYALASYQAAYLKAHYPAEFMSALIQQHISKRDKTLMHLREAKRMGLTVVPPHINESNTLVTPVSNTTIAFGLGCIKGVGLTHGENIVVERQQHGAYTTLQDFVERTHTLGLNSGVYKALVASGALDVYGSSRDAILKAVLDYREELQKNSHKGDNLFTMMNIMTTPTTVTIDTNKHDVFADRVAKEADVNGLFLSEHPTQHTQKVRGHTIQAVQASKNRNMEYTIPVAVTELTAKRARGKTSYQLTFEDDKNSVTVYVPAHISTRWQKHTAQQQILKALQGKSKPKPELWERATAPAVVAEPQPQVNYAYRVTLTAGGFNNTLRLTDIAPMYRSDDGTETIRIVVPVPSSPKKTTIVKHNMLGKLQKLQEDYPGTTKVVVAYITTMKQHDAEGIVSTSPEMSDMGWWRKVIQLDNSHRMEANNHIKQIVRGAHPINKNNLTTKQMKHIQKMHRHYPYEETSVLLDSKNRDLVYQLEALCGDGNYYIP